MGHVIDFSVDRVYQKMASKGRSIRPQLLLFVAGVLLAGLFLGAIPAFAAQATISPIVVAPITSTSSVSVPANVTYTDRSYGIAWDGPDSADRVALYYVINGEEKIIANPGSTVTAYLWNPPDNPDSDYPYQSVFHKVRIKAVWQVRDSTGHYDNISTAYSPYFTLAKPGSFVILNQSLPVGYTGQAYRVNLAAENGEKPYRWAIKSGYTLPDGLLMNANGQIYGNATSAGTKIVRFRVTDSGVDTISDETDLAVTIVRPGDPTPRPAAFNYSIRVNTLSDGISTISVEKPSEGSVMKGRRVVLDATSGTPETVRLTVTGNPSGVDCFCNPYEVLPDAGCTLNVTVHSYAEPGTYTLTVRGVTSSGLERTATVPLHIFVNTTGGDLYLARAYKPVELSENISIQPIQSFTSYDRLVKGKNTMFKATIGSTFNTDKDVLVELWLAESDWEWDGMPVASGLALQTESGNTYNFPRHIVYSRTVTVPASSEIEITIPDPGTEQTTSTIHTSPSNSNDEIDIVTNAPRPAHAGSSVYWTDEPEYTIVVDPANRITETNELNNVPEDGYHRMETYKSGELSLFYTSFLANEDELNDYYPGGTSGSSFGAAFTNMTEQAEGNSEFMLGVYPIGEENIHYYVSDGIILHDSAHTVDDLELLWMQNYLADVAAENGYDRIVGMVPWNTWYGGHDNWWGVVYNTNPRASFVRIHGDDYLIAVHENYHNLGHPDEYTEAHNISASDGYWFNRQETLAMSDDYLHDYMDYAGYPSYWTKKSRYETLMFQLPEAEDPKVLVFRCLLFKNGSASLKPFMIVDGVPDNQAREWNYRILMKDAGGNIVREQMVYTTFTKSVFGPSGSQSGTFPVDQAFITSTIVWSDNVTAIELTDRDGRLLASRTVSRSSPTVSITEPGPGSVWTYGGKYAVRWTASDADGDALNYSVAMSKDKVQWIPLALDLRSKEYLFDTKTMPPGTYYFRVRATDGVLSTSDITAQSVTIEESSSGVGNDVITTTVTAHPGVVTPTALPVSSETINKSLCLPGLPAQSMPSGIGGVTGTTIALLLTTFVIVRYGKR